MITTTAPSTSASALYIYIYVYTVHICICLHHVSHTCDSIFTVLANTSKLTLQHCMLRRFGMNELAAGDALA